MYYLKLKRITGLVALFAATVGAFVSTQGVEANKKKNPPDLPSVCDNIQVPSGAQLAFHAYALGVQVYRWNGTAWVFVEPVAKLFADARYHGLVGSHYAGPTWESNSGSKVVATRREGCPAPEPTAIDWLLLEAVSSEGPGVFDSITHIQRVNTVGGKAPTAPGTSIGARVDVPYTAEYYFYR
jgi:hypothetical protein